ncbi:hypothetical protein OsI_26553 [Oryza sativa Indica Group]|uniref:Uncharacterized protein n=1 Tax=Oryza sativa subsp. indica TaxID=39946 RepID=A2YMU8_ORYSI|nr:hypothetical protein OsI_26553 [Oryza sativa Indica Group]
MSSAARHHCSGLRERLGCVQCSFCATVLLVSVPCSSVLRVVGRAVRPLLRHPLRRQPAAVAGVGVHRADSTAPGRKQRTPSAYNCFVKEEIKRIKSMEPNITHKQAFSTAAKNWAHLPRIQQKRGRDSC